VKTFYSSRKQNISIDFQSRENFDLQSWRKNENSRFDKKQIVDVVIFYTVSVQNDSIC